MTAEESARRREREALQLTRSRVQQQLQVAREPRYVQQLQSALDDLNVRLAKLK